MFVKNGTSRLKKVLLSKPEYLKPAPINEIAKKWQSYELDVEKMLREHERLVSAYKQAEVEVEFLQADSKRPNSVFARDFGGCVKEGYILGRFKLPLRKQEQIDYKNKMETLKVPMIAQVQEGCFEGGDFAFLNENTIAIGMADRSNEKGVEEIQKQLLPYGYEVIPVPLKSEYLHLDMCFNLVDDHLAVAYKEGLPESFQKYLRKLDIKLICVSEESIFAHSCNLQSLGCHRVLSLKHNEVVNETLSKEGMEVIPLDITEILKAGGGPHCMTFPLWRE